MILIRKRSASQRVTVGQECFTEYPNPEKRCHGNVKQLLRNIGPEGISELPARVYGVIAHVCEGRMKCSSAYAETDSDPR
jgi:hypothetical protein